MLWWGLTLFLFKLSSRRQLDYQLNTDGPEVLDNLNRLAGTHQTTRPVNKTLELLPGPDRTGTRGRPADSTGPAADPHEGRRGARRQRRYIVAIDATGYLLFRYRHCAHCLTQQHGDATLYMHQALEAKLLGPADTVLSMGTAFIDNQDQTTHRRRRSNASRTAS